MNGGSCASQAGGLNRLSSGNSADRQPVARRMAVDLDVFDPVPVDAFEGFGDAFGHQVVMIAAKQPGAVPGEEFGIVDLAARKASSIRSTESEASGGDGRRPQKRSPQ
jgi:hypothetical protein